MRMVRLRENAADGTPHGGTRVKGVVFAAMVACTACAVRPADDREVRRQRLEADHRALVAQLEDLQARLIVDAERVRFWEEMRDRHQSISAIACTSQESHAIAMAEYLEHEQTVSRHPPAPRRQARVAAVRQPEPSARGGTGAGASQR